MIAIMGGLVGSLETATLDLRQSDVLIDGDRIAAVSRNLTVPGDAKVINATDRVILPGLHNAHTHAHSNITRGVADNWTLEDLLTFGPAVYGYRTPEEQYASAALGAIEMLKTGCTSANDMFMDLPIPSDDSLDAVAQAYVDVGMRACIAPQVSDRPFLHTVPGLMALLPRHLESRIRNLTAPSMPELARLTERFIRRWHGAADGRITAAVGPSIPGQCSDEFLSRCAAMSFEYGVGAHVHVAETKPQAVYALKRWGTTIVARLDDLGLLGPGFVGAHGIWTTAEDASRLAASGSAIAHNPASNLKTGSGIAPVRELLDADVSVGIGTDGSITSDNQNGFEAMRIAGLVGNARYPYQQDRWLTAVDVLRMEFEGGARILQRSGDLGALKPGYKADLMLLRTDSITLSPMNDPANTLVYSESGSSVDLVLVDGRVVMQGGSVLGVDEAAIRQTANATLERLRGTTRRARAEAIEIRPFVTEACRRAARSPYPVDRYFSGGQTPEGAPASAF